MSFYQGGGHFGGVNKPEDDDKKLFVGGLSWETSKEELKKYFEEFGEVTYCALKTDPNSGKSRGFGFITFADESSVIKVVTQREHELDKRMIDPKRAKSRALPEYGPPAQKIFVGGLDPNAITEEGLRDYFGKFGNIVDFSHPFDRVKKQKKGFCFITFDKPDVVHNIVGNKPSSKHKINGHDVEVKKAVEPQNAIAGYQDGWGQQGGWSGYQQPGWGQVSRGSGGRGDGYQGRGQGGWGGEQGYGSSSYSSGSYGTQGGYDSYGSQGYYSQQGYGNGYGYD